ncbi:hypothetical protein TIFTF001_023974 [Ficus carica]|uniref:Uncharacterized protein n=1 Tax=Ficus carica TaxID=3494 RepID=A0AA88AXK1_FICCA|nr:hypothetical protein TIFTF001_023974 [Ficus carica]
MESPSPPAATHLHRANRLEIATFQWRRQRGEAMDSSGKNPSAGSVLSWQCRSRSGRRRKVIGEEIGGYDVEKLADRRLQCELIAVQGRNWVLTRARCSGLAFRLLAWWWVSPSMLMPSPSDRTDTVFAIRTSTNPYLYPPSSGWKSTWHSSSEGPMPVCLEHVYSPGPLRIRYISVTRSTSPASVVPFAMDHTKPRFVRFPRASVGIPRDLHHNFVSEFGREGGGGGGWW